MILGNRKVGAPKDPHLFLPGRALLLGQAVVATCDDARNTAQITHLDRHVAVGTRAAGPVAELAEGVFPPAAASCWMVAAEAASAPIVSAASITARPTTNTWLSLPTSPCLPRSSACRSPSLVFTLYWGGESGPPSRYTQRAQHIPERGGAGHPDCVYLKLSWRPARGGERDGTGGR